jgi:hypothetical protein
MKKIFIVLLVAFTFLNSFFAEAQSPDRFPRIRERIAQAKLREIRFQLNLDQPTFERFRPIYLRYENEISGIDFRDMARLMRVNADSLSTEEADEMIVKQLETAKRIAVIREKYYREFRKVIEPQKIIKMYQTEADLRKKVMLEMRRRMMNR